MARCLIIGCGCRGRSLASALVGRGHLVRGTSRHPESLDAISAVGAEPVLGDPDRVATLVDALDHVTVVCILLGSANGSEEELAALHGTRLEMLLTKIVDTTARGIVYEAAGSVEHEILGAGADRVRAFGERSLAHVELLDVDPGGREAWMTAAVSAVEAAL